MNQALIRDLQRRLKDADLTELMRIDLELRLADRRDGIDRDIAVEDSIQSVVTEVGALTIDDVAHEAHFLGPIPGDALASVMAKQAKPTHLVVSDQVLLDLHAKGWPAFQPSNLPPNAHCKGHLGLYPVVYVPALPGATQALVRFIGDDGGIGWAGVHVVR